MTRCKSCKGLCCKYVTVDIPAPKDAADYDEIRWFVLHRSVIVYKVPDEKNWRIEFQTFCRYLDAENNICTEYAERPLVCREYTTSECGGLDELSQEGCEIYIASEDDLKGYMLKHCRKTAEKVFRTRR